MLAEQRGEAAAPGLQAWALRVTQKLDAKIAVAVHFEDDSNTYVVRLVKGARVLIFRLSASQVHADGREHECERTVARKVRDLWNLI